MLATTLLLVALLPVHPAGSNTPPAVQIISPNDCAFVPTQGNFEAQIEAAAEDPDGSIVAVRFYSRFGELCGVDSIPPYTSSCPLLIIVAARTPGMYGAAGFDEGVCSCAAGSFQPWTDVYAVAVDDLGATTTSDTIRIRPDLANQAAFGKSVPLSDFDFESTPLADGAQVAGPGTIGGWTFDGTSGASLGVLNPTAALYDSAADNGTPAGAGGANIAFLAVPAGAGDSARAFQSLPDTLRRYSRYWLQVAAGAPRGGPAAEFPFEGARFELKAGGTVIAQGICDSRWQEGTFFDLTTVAVTDLLPQALIGQALSVHVALNADAAARSVHFDRVRLVRENYRPPGVPVDDGPPAARLLARAIPNPAAGAGTIEFWLPARGRVELSLFDPAGRRVGAPAVHELSAGLQRLPLPADLAPGIYFAHLTAGSRTASIRFVRLGL